MVVVQKTYICCCWKIYKMKELLIRSLSGLVFVTLMTVSAFLSQTACFIIFFLCGILCVLEFTKLIQLKGYLQYIIFTAFLSVFTFLEIANQFKIILLGLTLLVNLYLITNLFSKQKTPITTLHKYIYSSFYISSSFVFLLALTSFQSTYNPYILLGCFVLIWVNDSFAYLVGKNFGKHKLFERISPKKTIEGFIGGIIFSCIASFFIAKFTNTLTFPNWLIIALIISTFGTIGDLIQSKFKRQAGVKDSGALLPGHGGIYDRLDSLIFSAPFVYTYLIILNYVS